MTRRVRLPLIVIGAILGVGLLHVAGVLRPVEDGMRWVLLPVARVFAAFGTQAGQRAGSGRTPAECEERVTELESRVSSVSVDYVSLKALEEENRSLRKVAKFLNDSGYDHLGARVIARSSPTQAATILIDRGAGDGLELGMAVVVGDGVYVGKITSLSRRVSAVTLVTDESSRVAASVAGADKLLGLVQGQGNGVVRLTLVPQAEPLKQNDLVVTAGTEEKIPANLAIALVDQVEGTATDPFKVATLDPLVQADRLDLVVVLRPAALRPNDGP